MPAQTGNRFSRRQSTAWHCLSLAMLVLVALSAASTTGAQAVTAAAPLVTWEHAQLNPAAAGKLVVWEDHHWGFGADSDIYGRLLDGTGAPTGTHFGIAYNGTRTRHAPDVAYSAEDNAYLVVYEYAYAVDDYDIYAQRVGADGTLLGTEVVLAASFDDERLPAVTFNPVDNQYLVVWQRETGSDEFVHNDIYARRLNPDGTMDGAAFQVTTDIYDQRAPAVAHEDVNNRYLVAFQDNNSPPLYDEDIRGQLISNTGSLVGSPINISSWEEDQLKPRLAFDNTSDQFLVVWEDHHWGFGANWDIYGQRLSYTGGALGGNFGVSYADQGATDDRVNPDIAYNASADEYLVTFGYALTVSDHFAGYRRVDGGTGALLGVEHTWPAGDQTAIATAVTDVGTGWTTVWEDDRNWPTTNRDLYADTVTTSATALDLSIDHIELTQVIQCKDNTECADNSVPLIAGKPTFVRVYVGLDNATGDVSGVSGRAVATINGSEITAVQLNGGFTARQSPNRAQSYDTLNFLLPDHLVAQSGSLEVTINHDLAVDEATHVNNTSTVALNFVHTPILNIVPVRVVINGEIVPATMPGHMLNYAENLFPAPSINFVMPPPVLVWSDPVGPDGASWDKLNAKLDQLRQRDTTRPADAIWYGMVPFGEVSGFAGKAYGSTAASGRVVMQHENLEDTADIFVHEIGHNFDRPHAPSGAPWPDPNYPYTNADIGDVGWDLLQASGGKTLDLLNGWTVPANTADVMSYRQDEWISEYTYQAILDKRGYTATPPVPAEPPVVTGFQPYLFAGGWIDGDSVELEPWLIMDRPLGFSDESGSGPYQIRVIDEGGTPLFERFFDLPVLFEEAAMPGETAIIDEAPPLFFNEALPWPAEAVGAELRRLEDGVLLAEITLSPSPPEIVLDAPVGGEQWTPGDDHTIAWTAFDPDGDPLYFDVYFSRDDGETWQTIAVGIDADSLIVHGSQLPGSGEARVRVVATDGLRTTSATSDIFTMESHAPLAAIVLPENGAGFETGESVELLGVGFDAEDGELADSALAWYSDVQGFLGTGPQRTVNLDLGPHLVSLTATDSDGNSASAALRIHVGVPTGVSAQAPSADIAVRLWVTVALLLTLLGTVVAWLGRRRGA